MPPVGERTAVAAALPGTIHDLVGKTQLAESTVRRWLRALRDDKQCFVISWKRTSGIPTPRYAPGPGVDVAKPKAKSNAAYSRKWRKNKREEKAEFDAARLAARENVAKVVRVKQTWASALMGGGEHVSIIHVVSVSGGKDSAATLLLAIERFGTHRVRAIFCDTGNEHAAVYAYLDYLELATGVTIHRLKADFSGEIARKRMFIARDQRTRRNPNGRKVRWTNKAKRRALAVLHPTGNAFLDLCLWKGRFPSRKAQFCTEHLKRNLAVEYQLSLIDQGYTVVSWQGVRRDESLARRNAKKFEPAGGGLFNYRPLVDWTAMDVFSYCASKGIEPNPLYKQGMGRVGCMPCVNAKKSEVKEIAARFPIHIDRISEWESLICQSSKLGYSTFFNSGNSPVELKGKSDLQIFEEANIWMVVQWAQTSRGGRQFSLLTALDEPTACASSYGLCE